MSGDPGTTLGTWQSLKAVARSWRLASVALLSFPSGLPLGLVWLAVPAWMTQEGVDIKVVGLFTLAQAPWSFKVLWAPLMERFAVPVLGRRRGWVLVTQALLLVLGVAMAAAARGPVQVGVVALLCLLTAVVSATQDVAYDGYTVEVLRREEHGVAVAARVTLYRIAMWVSGRLSITVAGWLSWAAVHLGLALVYLPSLLVTARAPEPEVTQPPARTIRDAVWEPLLGLLAQHRALEILAFVALYKLSDNLTQALTGPFLIQVGFTPVDVGVASGTIGLLAIVFGTFLGGILTQVRGLGPGLWISGLLQVFSNLGYAVVAVMGVNRPVMYSAQAFEYVTTGMGNGAFGVLLLRLTQKRFSVTQFALLSTLFALPRILAGPVAGLMADAMGWRDFFLSTLLFGVPGLVMLQRFVPWGVKEVEFHVAPPAAGRPVRRTRIGLLAAAAGVAGWGLGLVTAAGLGAIKSFRAGRGFDLAAQIGGLVAPRGLAESLTVAGVWLLALLAAFATAAALVARRGVAGTGRAPAPDE